ncbi:MAG: IclR family transcriptional regulator [Actinobacteria bacterium]|nr:MAG: IclR family transcriptional regulator [Actinomycetota bacterium]
MRTQDSGRPLAGPSEDTAQATRAVVDKAFTVLEAWRRRDEVLGVSELARRTGLPKSTSHRLLGLLEAAGVVERGAAGHRLGDRLHGFSALLSADSPPELREVSLPYLQDLYELTHETIHLAVLDGVDVHCVEKLYGHRRSPLRSRVGGLLPAHSTALGKALLAYSDPATQRRALTRILDGYTTATVTQPSRLAAELRTTRLRGLAFDRRETHPEVMCVAAPILDHQGRVVAAISISGTQHRFDPAAVAEPLRRTARAASVALAGPRAA